MSRHRLVLLATVTIAVASALSFWQRQQPSAVLDADSVIAARLQSFAAPIMPSAAAEIDAREHDRGDELDREREREREEEREEAEERKTLRPGRSVRGREPRFDSPGEAIAWRYSRQVDENGEIPDGALMRAKAQADAMRAAQPFRPDAAGISNAAWTWLGPGNIGGRIRAVAIHPTTTSTIFVGSVGGGIWKSIDSGANWTVVNDFMANLAVTSIVFQPGNPLIMYAGTGEGFANIDAIRGAGIFKSTDGGTTWTQLPTTANSNFFFVNRLAFSNNGLIILAATGSGLWKSSDAGANWTKVLTPPALTSTVMYDVKFLPGSNTQAVASSRDRLVFYTTIGTDLGNWTASASITSSNFLRIEIGVSVSSPSTVYLSVESGSNAGEVWRSIDSGVTYTKMAGSPNALGGQGWYDNTIWVDPSNVNRVVVGGTTLASSTDGGASWTTRNYGSGIHPDQHAIVHDPGYNGTSNRKVYIGNDGGLYVTNDITTSPFTSVTFTTRNNGLGITQFYGAAGNTTSGKIIGGTQDNGTLLYTPAGGTTWTSPYGGDGGYSAADPTDPNYLYGEYVDLNIHRNTTGGTSFSEEIYGYKPSTFGCKALPYKIPDACDSPTKANFIAPFILDPNNANRMLAGGHSLWRTNDVKTPNTDIVGPSWAAIKPPDGVSNYISAIAVAPGNSDIIWVGHNSTGALFKTTNGTAANPTWTNMRSGAAPTGRTVGRFAIDPANNNIVYVAYEGFNASNLWKTIDGGGTWASASGSGVTALPSAPIYSVVVHPTVAGWVYVGTEIGVFASTDGGATWSLPHDGPANVSVDELFWMGSSLIAVTHGRGVFSASTCPVTLAPTSGSAPYTGGGGTITVTTTAGCSWTPSSNAAWLTTSGTGTGNGSFTYTAAANTGVARNGTITVGTSTFVLSQAAGPSMTVNRSTLAFGATNSGGVLSNITSPQVVTVTFAAVSPTWTATTSTPWLLITGGAGTGNGQFTVTARSAAGLPATGTVSGSVTITSGGVSNSPQTLPVTLTLFASTTTSAAPFGSFDTPASGASVEGSIAVTGWALDDIEVQRVEIWRDKVPGETTPGYPGPGLGTGKVYIADALFINGARTDVEGLYPTLPYAYRAGWGYLMLTWGLWNQGNSAFTFYAFAYDRDGHAVSLGSKVITVSNATATRPFGSIDVPTYGGTMSGVSFNFGWALTPNATPPCTIINGNVFVSVDSAPLTPVSYGDTRPDIQAGFPGFSNGSNSGGAFLIDTTTMSNGAHQIGWFVVDNCARAEGIGSRFFTVLNGGSGTVPTPDEPPASRVVSIPEAVIADAALFDAPVEVHRGTEATPIYPGLLGDRIVTIGQSERVEVQLPASDGKRYTGYQVVNGERRPLPLGSSLDAEQGIFYWQPAAGFLGSHDLEFVTSPDGAPVRVRAVIGSSVQAVIDIPQPGDTAGAFTIAGWAIDLAANEGTGIDAVHVWAYPATGAAPIFLGEAAYGDGRPDIGALFGAQFMGASFSLAVDGLAPGVYDVVVYPHSALAGDFRGAQTVRVRIP